MAQSHWTITLLRASMTLNNNMILTKDRLCGITVDPFTVLHIEHNGNSCHFVGRAFRAEVPFHTGGNQIAGQIRRLLCARCL